jgi:DNA-directed RNA polymerase subunit RPC12/RpoP
MGQETNETNAPCPGAFDTASEDYLWIKCRGCGGEVGVPSEWDEPDVECPSCGLTVQVQGRVLYRPPVSSPQNVAPAAELPTRTQPPTTFPKSPSLELGGRADWAMTWGILSVALGWTVLVPLLGLHYYLLAANSAQNEGVQLPRKALVGVILSLPFGAVQTIALIAHLNK